MFSAVDGWVDTLAILPPNQLVGLACLVLNWKSAIVMLIFLVLISGEYGHVIAIFLNIPTFTPNLPTSYPGQEHSSKHAPGTRVELQSADVNHVYTYMYVYIYIDMNIDIDWLKV